MSLMQDLVIVQPVRYICVYKHDAVPQKSACIDKPCWSPEGKWLDSFHFPSSEQYWAKSRRGDGATVSDPYLCCRSAAKVVCLPS